MNSPSTRRPRRRPFGDVYRRRGFWEWRLFDRLGGRLLAKGRATDNFAANRAMNTAAARVKGVEPAIY